MGILEPREYTPNRGKVTLFLQETASQEEAQVWPGMRGRTKRRKRNSGGKAATVSYKVGGLF
jgi:hypothetical protein